MSPFFCKSLRFPSVGKKGENLRTVRTFVAKQLTDTK